MYVVRTVVGLGSHQSSGSLQYYVWYNSDSPGSILLVARPQAHDRTQLYLLLHAATLLFSCNADLYPRLEDEIY